MKKLLLTIFAVFALGLLTGCPSEALPGIGDGEGGSPPLRAPMPVIAMTPNRTFNTGDITINFTSTTPEPVFFYTLDGSEPTSASRRFGGPFPLRIADTGANDRVTLRVIGTGAGLAASPINTLTFHIAERRRHGDFTGTRTDHGEGIGYLGGRTRVILTLVDGFIDAVTIHTGYGGTATESDDEEEGLVFWTPAHNHAHEFMMVMSCVEFDVLTGATGSSESIQDGARQALARILAQ